MWESMTIGRFEQSKVGLGTGHLMPFCHENSVNSASEYTMADIAT